MNTVQLYPQYSKTLKLTEKHDEHILQLTATLGVTNCTSH